MSPTAADVQKPTATAEKKPGGALVVKRFTIDSALELVADEFTAEVPDATPFQSASEADRVTLKAGLLDEGNVPAFITMIKDGVVDEYELTITPTDLRCRLRGRDASAAILDRHFERTYLRADDMRDDVVVELLDDPAVRAAVSEGSAGIITARTIAQDAVGSSGLDLLWDVPDYTIVETFHARGRIIDTLRQLVEPYTLVGPFRADIYVLGKTVTITKQTVTGPPDLVVDIAAARRSRVVVRKRPLQPVGNLILRGQTTGLESSAIRAAAVALDKNVSTVPASAAFGPMPGTPTFSVTGVKKEVELVSETRDENDKIVTQTRERRIYIMPDNNLVESVKSVSTQGEGGKLHVTTQETTTRTYEPPVYNLETGTLVNQPKMLSETLVREDLDPTDLIFGVRGRDTTRYSWDALGFMSGSATIKERFDKRARPPRFENVAMIVRTLRDIGALLAEQITETFSWNDSKKRWSLRDRVAEVQGGYRPGGAGAFLGNASKQTRIVGGADTSIPPIEYNNPNLSQDDLAAIAEAFTQAKALKWEWEILFDGIAMPWVKRGSVVQFIGVADAEGNAIELPAVRIQDVHTTYDEGADGVGVSVQAGRGVGYTEV